MNSLYFLLYPLVFAAMFLAWYAQSRVKRVFQEEDRISIAGEITGLEAARELLNNAGLYQVRVEIRSGLLTDQYDPVDKVLRLSPRTARHDSTLAVGVAAHEVGHAIQDAERYGLMRAHTFLARWLMVLATVSPVAFIGGFLFGSVPLMIVAVAILALQLIFALVTLPLERNASIRALHLLEEQGIIVHSEEGSVQRVLRAAAFTYLASVGIRLAFFLFWFIVVASIAKLGGGN